MLQRPDDDLALICPAVMPGAQLLPPREDAVLTGQQFRDPAVHLVHPRNDRSLRGQLAELSQFAIGDQRARPSGVVGRL